ncbi:YitT family protein [Oscillospiraceae bacterium PP1C4]
MINASHTNKYLNMGLDMLFNLAGCGLFAIALHVFVAPNQIAPGGVSGLSVVLNYLTGLPIGIWSFIINIPLLLIGTKFLGWWFTGKTLVTVVTLSVMIDYVVVFLPEYTGDALLASLFSGALMGTGLAIVFMRGSTTGGSDIVSRLVQLKYPHIQLGKMLLAIDVVVILISTAVFNNIETALYSMVVVFTSAKVVDSVLYGLDTGKLVYVMSRKSVEISKEVLTELQRGCTLLKSTGAFTQNDSQVLLVAVRRSQYFQLKRIVHTIDPTAFIIVTDSSEVIGEGFNPITK